MVLSGPSQGSGGWRQGAVDEGVGSRRACEELVGDFLEHLYAEEAEEDALGGTRFHQI